jgi:hypothetical protein
MYACLRKVLAYVLHLCFCDIPVVVLLLDQQSTGKSFAWLRIRVIPPLRFVALLQKENCIHVASLEALRTNKTKVYKQRTTYNTTDILRQHGAEWPALLRFNGDPWSGDVLQWARDEGCTSRATSDATTGAIADA